MLLFTPHTVQVLTRTQAVGSNNVNNGTDYVPGAILHVQIAPKTPEATYMDYGIEWHRPHKMMMQPGDAGSIKHQDKVQFGTRQFHVVTMPKINVQGLPTDHASVMLDEVL